MQLNDLKYYEGQIERFVELVNKAFSDDICKNFSELIDKPSKIRCHIVLATTRLASSLEFDGIIKRIKTQCKIDNNIDKVLDHMVEIRKLNLLHEESNLVTLSSVNMCFADAS